MVPLRLAFLGTPNFAVPTLDALVAAGHELLCVYSQPPRPSGRGKRVQPSPVQAFAAARGISLRTPVSLKPQNEQQAFAALDLDAAVVAAYGLILPDAVLEAPRLGCLNLHASLLPRWRGAAPIQRAILAGDRETGVTIMQVEQALDSGPILRQQAVPIQPDATAASLHDDLAVRGAALMVEALEALDQGKLVPRPQPAEGITYAKKLSREEGRLDWQRPAVELERQVRAFAPWPGAFTTLPGRDGPEPLKVLAARVVASGPGEGAQVPGRVLDDALTVACGADALRLVTVQRPGKSAMPAARFLRGFPLAAGCQLDAPGARPSVRSR